MVGHLTWGLSKDIGTLYNQYGIKLLVDLEGFPNILLWLPHELEF